jgi:hypothetical protein
VNDLEHEVRRALRDIADEARPVPLGRRALARVRRRRERRTRALTALAAAVLAAVVVPRLLGGDEGPADRAPDLAGRNVTAAYYTANDVRVLNPVTGEYRPTDLAVETVTADLRFAAGTRLAGYPATFPATEPRIGVLDTRTGALEWYPMSDPVDDTRWSPDGRHVVARLGEPGSYRAVLLTPAEAKEHMVNLEVPADRLVVSLCWADTDRLLAVTAPRAGARETGTQDLMVFDREGWRLRTVTIPDTWNVDCAGRQGRVLVTRLAEQRPTASVVPPEVAVVDLNAGTVTAPVRLPWAGSIQPMAWRTDRSFLASSQDHLLAVDLDLGTATEIARKPAVTATSYPLAYSVLVPADGLDRYAREIYPATF